jgi:hypothetical protein
MNPRKVAKLFISMMKVQRLSRELGVPQIFDHEKAALVVQACVEHGPVELKQAVLGAFNGSETVQ